MKRYHLNILSLAPSVAESTTTLQPFSIRLKTHEMIASAP